MRIIPKSLAFIVLSFGAVFHLCSQGYIVPNGISYAGLSPSSGYQFDVIHDPTNFYSTSFFLAPRGETPPTLFTNTFQFDAIVDVSVRVFLVSANQPISQQSIQSGSYTELMFGNNYVFNHGVTFYVGLYTGNDIGYPPNGIYEDPLFGWAKLRNFGGAIQLLDSALVYKAQGIYAGTQNIVPEPSGFSLTALGALLLVFSRLLTSAATNSDRRGSFKTVVADVSPR